MIELSSVTKVFDADGQAVKAVDSLSLSIADGETVCLIGPSGCGKTTTMKLINRLIEPTSGKVIVFGRDVQEEDEIKLRRKIGYVVQEGGLFPHKTVAENVGLLCRLEGWKEEQTAERVSELLSLVNLDAEEHGGRYPRDLSGGQRQRVSVARALALDPAIILMDEPFGALDPITRDQIHNEFLQLRRAVGKTVVIVTHDMAEAFKLGDRVALLDQGRLIQMGARADFLEHPENEFVERFLRSHLRTVQDAPTSV